MFGTMVALIAVEVALRTTGIGQNRLRSKRMLNNLDAPVYYHLYTSNPNGEFRPLPDTSHGRWVLKTTMLPPTELPLEMKNETPFCVEYRNSLLPIEGRPVVIRDRAYPLIPAEGKQRMLMIGDSFAYGEGVPLERTLFRQLESRLGPSFQVMDAGRPGFDTSMELARAQRLVPQLGVRRVLLVFIPNDIRLTDELIARQTFINDLINIRDEILERHESSAWYSGSPRVVQWFGSAWEMRRIAHETIRWYLDSYDPHINGKNLDLLAYQIGQFAKLPNCRVAMVIYPLMEGLERSYPFAEIHARVAEMARRAGIPALDLAPVFAGCDTQSLWVHPADHHPNGKAHRMAAERIAKWLSEEVPGYLEHPAGRATPAKRAKP